MKEQLQIRLQSLKAEYEAGQTVLADLETKQANIRDTLLRISGAIQVIEEELEKANAEANGSDYKELSSVLDVAASETPL